MRKEGRLRLADNESLFVKCVQRLGSHAFGCDIHHPIRDGASIQPLAQFDTLRKRTQEQTVH